MLAAWRAGNNSELAAELSDAYKQFPELYRVLVSERNERWLPQIRGYLNADHNVLVVVGALHLVGKGGLLDLLKNAGIIATPVLGGATPAAQGPSSSRH